MPHRRAIAWLRRDLRVNDNRTLAMATAQAERAWPVFVVDPALLRSHAAAAGRVAWIAANVRALDASLGDLGSGLTVLYGAPEVELRRFAARVGADAVVAAADEDPMAVARDRRVAAEMELRLVDDQRILPPADVRSGTGEAYSVYTPFRRALEARIANAADDATASAQPRLDRLAPRPAAVGGAEAFAAPEAPHALPDAGERAAEGRLRAFLATRLRHYRADRDSPGLDATSHISPDLRVGALSIRACWRAALNATRMSEEGGDTQLARAATSWRGELAWREFFAGVMAANPRLATESYRREYDGLAWNAGDAADAMLAAWRAGRTGFPFVDAGMRQLAATGWMHNRARLVTASFLVKDAGIDWRRGEAAFAEHLIDADIQQNNGNWQWVAGVGTDAAPYFRIFNPVLQGRKFDPTGAYVRRWVPELRHLPDEVIHEPWRSKEPPRDYPLPILDHSIARQQALERYGQAGASAKRRAEGVAGAR